MSMPQMGSDGGLKVNAEGMKATFAIAIVDLALAATPTDVFILNGSATKTVKVQRIEVVVSGATGASAVADLQLTKRSAANSGGTSSASAIAVIDSADGTAATAVALQYTANPTTGATGTGYGLLRAEKIAYATPGATVGPAALDAVIWEFGTRPGSKELTLRGVAEGVAINFNGSTMGGTSTATINVEFTEEPTTV